MPRRLAFREKDWGVLRLGRSGWQSLRDEWQMPIIETRESIEAELHGDPQANFLAMLDRLKREVLELDQALMRAESLRGNPAHWRSHPVPERMRRVGLPEEAIGKYERFLRWLVAVAAGGPLPDDLLKEIEEQRAVSTSVAEQLARIVHGARPKS
jgi:hypothetical protein